MLVESDAATWRSDRVIVHPLLHQSLLQTWWTEKWAHSNVVHLLHNFPHFSVCTFPKVLMVCRWAREHCLTFPAESVLTWSLLEHRQLGGQTAREKQATISKFPFFLSHFIVSFLRHYAHAHPSTVSKQLKVINLQMIFLSLRLTFSILMTVLLWRMLNRKMESRIWLRCMVKEAQFFLPAYTKKAPIEWMAQ